MIRRSALFVALAGALCGFSPPALRADVKLPPLFTDNMVLQQGMQVPVWGTAGDGEKVTVSIQGQTVTAEPKDGKWMVRLDKLQSGGPFEMTVAGNNKIVVKNVLVGDVWVCSGQSNMQWPIRLSADPEKTIAESKNPQIRLFSVPHTPVPFPQKSVRAKWTECGPETTPEFSAVAYFFGRELQRARNVPIGLIHTSVGGTPAEAWTSREALQAEPSLRYYVERADKALEGYSTQIDKHIEAWQKYKEEVAKALAEHRPLPSQPGRLANPAENTGAGAYLYNGMIEPLLPYAIHGAIWYQGESNAGRAWEYRTLLATMIKNWRQAWGQGDFPFLIVQLAPFMKIKPEPGDSTWAELREAQLLQVKNLPKVGIAVITDVGHESDIHPKWKEPVGARLALAARALADGESITYSGPIFRDMKVDGDRAILSFDHVGRGLVSKGGPVVGFTIAGEDHKFLKADAQIQDDKVVVSSPQVKNPVAVRFGWADFPVVNLWNQDGLPASPFRTDDFPAITQGKSAAKAR